ncbi:MurR/RpiR family transcriptional regulator [Streptococcus merionis]|uniref:Putative HTH-type transcriptional regulator n=1 Tax=Streptococcus merionis TaxID=400065 RepID=A0A239SQG3_9STRE|nr:MurR/RpiR family transcriptional regulator [Streptococcus merionis]SNU87695.1 putative HTH-type transcriptional regulator [Streptococcus merionis]
MFLNNLKANYEKLSVGEQEVVDYLMRHEEIENITIKTICADLYTSSSTVVRACKKIGYRTYNELKYDLRLSKELQANLSKRDRNSFEIIKNQLSVEFQQTMGILSEDDFVTFADCILNARRIFCIGVGSSYMAMADFNRKLKLINVWSNDYFEQYSIERIKDISIDEDVILVFSLGGNSQDVNESILAAKNNGTTILSITTLGNNLLSKVSDNVIYIYDAPKKREKLRSRLMFNLVGTLLFEVVLSRIGLK